MLRWKRTRGRVWHTRLWLWLRLRWGSKGLVLHRRGWCGMIARGWLLEVLIRGWRIRKLLPSGLLLAREGEVGCLRTRRLRLLR